MTVFEETRDHWSRNFFTHADLLPRAGSRAVNTIHSTSFTIDALKEPRTWAALLVGQVASTSSSRVSKRKGELNCAFIEYPIHVAYRYFLLIRSRRSSSSA
mmetsp:Transcript_52417/g.78316  ORF Transcript_52417/g.78316 Transcript_52417/m.78316 type:complete len:101 (-) Transcript_52417:245-547(-)